MKLKILFRVLFAFECLALGNAAASFAAASFNPQTKCDHGVAKVPVTTMQRLLQIPSGQTYMVSASSAAPTESVAQPKLCVTAHDIDGDGDLEIECGPCETNLPEGQSCPDGFYLRDHECMANNGGLGYVPGPDSGGGTCPAGYICGSPGAPGSIIAAPPLRTIEVRNEDPTKGVTVDGVTCNPK